MSRIGFFSLLLILTALPVNGQQKDLSYFIQAALSNSPLLKEAHSQQEISTLDSLLIRSANLPQLNFASVNSHAPVISGYGYDEVVTNGSDIAATVILSKTILGGKNMKTQFQSVHIEKERLKNAAKISAKDLERTVVDQYLLTYGNQQDLDLYQEINEISTKEEKALKKLTEKNVYKQTDYLSFLVSYQDQIIKIKQLEMVYQSNFGILNYLCGIHTVEVEGLAEPVLYLKEIPKNEESIFFKQFEIDSLKLINDKAIIDMAYRPKIDVFVDAGYRSSLAFQPQKNFGASFGFSVIVPLYDGKQKSLNHRKIAIQENNRVAYRDFFKTQFRQEVTQLKQQLKINYELLQQINIQIHYTESLVNANRKLLETGSLGITDYIISVNNYISAKYLLRQNNIEKLQIINRINYWSK